MILSRTISIVYQHEAFSVVIGGVSVCFPQTTGEEQDASHHDASEEEYNSHHDPTLLASVPLA